MNARANANDLRISLWVGGTANALGLDFQTDSRFRNYLLGFFLGLYPPGFLSKFEQISMEAIGSEESALNLKVRVIRKRPELTGALAATGIVGKAEQIAAEAQAGWVIPVSELLGVAVAAALD